MRTVMDLFSSSLHLLFAYCFFFGYTFEHGVSNAPFLYVCILTIFYDGKINACMHIYTPAKNLNTLNLKKHKNLNISKKETSYL